MMKDATDKRAQDSKSLTSKQAAKADMEAELESHKESKGSHSKELSATNSYISNLHGECDWIVKYHPLRKESRTGEVESLKNAKAVLSGADYSFVQTGVRGFLARSA